MSLLFVLIIIIIVVIIIIDLERERETSSYAFLDSLNDKIFRPFIPLVIRVGIETRVYVNLEFSSRFIVADIFLGM